MTRDGEKIAAAIGCLGIIPALAIGWVLNAWAIVLLWGWFILPTWGVLAPSRPAALGLSMLLGLLHSTPESPRDPTKTTGEIIAKCYGTILLKAPMVVGFAWIVKHWM